MAEMLMVRALFEPNAESANACPGLAWSLDRKTDGRELIAEQCRIFDAHRPQLLEADGLAIGRPQALHNPCLLLIVQLHRATRARDHTQVIAR
jgi:hypothetical protein